MPLTSELGDVLLAEDGPTLILEDEDVLPVILTEAGDELVEEDGSTFLIVEGDEGGTGTLRYTIYRGDDAGGPIDYTTPVATTYGTSWATPALDAPSDTRWGVRVTDTASGLEEENVDAAVRIVVGDSGADVTGRPRPPATVRAYAAKGGVVRVEWSYPWAGAKPTGFKVYAGSPTPDYSTPIATVPAAAGVTGTWRADLSGLADGSLYAVAVRAYNATAEDPGVDYVTVRPDATPPGSVDDLSGAASTSD